MSLIENIIRPEIRALSAYHVADAAGMLKLDAMENPYPLPPALREALARRLADVAMNRYPTPTYVGLKQKIRAHLGIPAGLDVLLGNGSDELIAMISVACARPGAKVLAPVPGFVMYAMSALFSGLEFVGVPLRADLTLDRDAMLRAVAKHKPAVVYLAYPNNPTGTLFDERDMLDIVAAVGETGMVVVDEAYQPFAQASFMRHLAAHPNLVVMRTLSKLGLAGIRLGYLSASDAVLAELDKVRPPYNINVLTEAVGEFLLDHLDVLDDQAARLRAARTELAGALAAIPGMEVFPSAANFLLVRVSGAGFDSQTLFDRLLARRVLIKNVGKMHPLLKDCLRVTVSTPEENGQFLSALQAALTS